MLNVTTCLKLSSPALCMRTSALYVVSGLEPVGRPSTKGLSAVGANLLIRCDVENQIVEGGDTCKRRLLGANEQLCMVWLFVIGCCVGCGVWRPVSAKSGPV